MIMPLPHCCFLFPPIPLLIGILKIIYLFILTEVVGPTILSLASFKISWTDCVTAIEMFFSDADDVD